MERNSWLRSLHQRCPKHWIDSLRKFQDHLQTQGIKINLNDDDNKNIFIISTTKINMNQNICMYTYSNTVPESPSPSTSEGETTATSSIISLFQSDSESDQSTDSLPPSPKQPRIKQEPELSVDYGGTIPLLLKFEHIFVAVISFPPLFCADTFDTSLLLIVCALNDCEMSLSAPFLRRYIQKRKCDSKIAHPKLEHV